MAFFKLNSFKILKSFHLTGGIIWILETVYGTEILLDQLNYLRSLESGTVGREVANLLDKNGYRLIQKFESHDLKHLILDYEMTMKDEIKMQAYLIGNGNLTLPCLLFFSLGIFYPKIWNQLYKEYQQGKASQSIYDLTLDQCLYQNLEVVKGFYGRHSSVKN